jgi:hypothetical protein
MSNQGSFVALPVISFLERVRYGLKEIKTRLWYWCPMVFKCNNSGIGGSLTLLVRLRLACIRQ